MRAVLLAPLLLGACFGPSLGDAPFMCGSGGVCPDGYHCQPAGNVCVRDGAADAGVSCQPRSFQRCEGSTYVACNANGDGEVRTFCAFACNTAAERCEQCDPAKATQCMGPTSLVTCDGTGQVTDSHTCPGYCEPGAGVPACVTLVASNLATTTCDAPGLASRRIAASVNIDTNACSGGAIVSQCSVTPCTGAAPPMVCMLKYLNFTVDAGVRVTASGANAIAVVATGSMTINGILDVSAIGPASGPGVIPQSLGQGGTLDNVYSNGGGGAGYGTDGKAGGTESDTPGGPPGSQYGTANLIPMRAGAPGGVSGNETVCPVVSCPLSKGGGGGGALQLVACSSLTIGVTAKINSAGAGGLGGAGAGSPVDAAGGGGGGGAGGAVLIEAPAITVPSAGPAGASVTANGGAGGGGGERSSNSPAAGHPGDDGNLSSFPAMGGNGGAAGAGGGGNGGTRGSDLSNLGLLPTGGARSTKGGYGGGGGGGAAGRIRFNTRSDLPPTVGQGADVSPNPTLGAVMSHP